MPITISDYLPPAGSSVRFRAEQPSVAPCSSPTRLVRVDDLALLAAKNPKAKISVTYAAMGDGQNEEHVDDVTSIAIDLDVKPGHASRDQIMALRERFPGAAIVWSNGATLLYRIHPMTWHQALPFAYQIAKEAERITGLSYDIGTHFRKSGEPGKQRNHLFRYPAGWASRRNAPVEFFEPLNSNRSIIDDAVGLHHPPIQPPPPRPPSARNRDASGDLFAESESTSGSIDTTLCSTLLRHGRAARREGKSIEQAAEFASVATGHPLAEVKLLFSRPGYIPGENIGKGTRRWWSKDAIEVGMIGLQSSSRRIQRSRTMLANFGHSLQSFWDAGCEPVLALEGVLRFPEFEAFRNWFRSEYGVDWGKAMWEDVEACHLKFGLRTGLALVSESTLRLVQQALEDRPLSAPAIAKITGRCLRQIKRALYQLRTGGSVIPQGKNKGKVWSLYRDTHKELDERKEKEGMGVEVALHRFPSERKVGQRALMELRAWKRPLGCPANTPGAMNRVKVAVAAQRKAVKKEAAASRRALEAQAKDENTIEEIQRLHLPTPTEQWLMKRPADYRQIKGAWGYALARHLDGMSPGKPPLPLREWLVSEVASGGLCVLARIAQRRRSSLKKKNAPVAPEALARS